MNKEDLHRYFEGVASPADVAAIRKWLDASPDNMQQLLRERRFYDTILFTDKPLTRSKHQGFQMPRIVVEALKIAAVAIIVLTLNNLAKDREDVTEAFQTISVPFGQRINITLPDGTNVWLNARTTIKYPQTFAGKSRDVFIDGEAYFDVVKDKNKPFVVQTAKSNLEVLGTTFNIEDYSDKDYFEAMLLAGSLKVSPKDTLLKTVVLQPEQKLVLSKDRYEVSHVEDYSTYRWREGLICFKNESFASIMADFEKYYGLEIVIQSENVKKQSYSGKFRQVDGIDYALRVLQKDIPFKYTRDDEHDKITIK
jgi:ferric-dicitrate binding protein FerR (iron transport regulator)